MRNFIDIISKSLDRADTNKLLEGANTTLLEAKHFEAMFSVLEALGKRYQQDYILQQVAECKQVVKALKRSDRQAWAARILRIWMFESLAGWNISKFESSTTRQDDGHGDQKRVMFTAFQSEVTKLTSKYLGEYVRTVGVDYVSDIQATPALGAHGPKVGIQRLMINHYLGIPYTKIQNYIFNNSMQQTMADLAGLEDEYKNRTKSLVAMTPGDKVIIKLPDNFVWVMLDRGYCSVEASAMGHCGNAGAKSDDRILSLRRVKDTVDGVAYMEIFLTFILNGDGKLGEMKGRANEKPAARYHDQIVELLRNPIVKGLRGGGYMPGNNFNINDLPDDVKEKLLDTHPHLGDWQAKLRRARAAGDEEALKVTVLDALKDTTSWGDKARYDEDGQLVVYEWAGVSALVEEMSEDDHTLEVSSGEYYADFNGEIGSSECESLIDSLPLQYQIALGQIAQGYVGGGDDEDEYADDFDPASSSDIYRVLEENGDENADALQNAIRSGNEAGAQNEAHSALESAIKGFTPEKGKMVFSTYERENGEKGWAWDSPVKLVLTLDEACEIADSAATNAEEEYPEDDDLKTMLFDEDAEIKIDANYYDDYDEDYAIERFEEETTIDSDSIEKKPNPAPDFDEMPIPEVKAWIEAMYDKIPDGYIRKVHTDAISEDRIRASAKGLFKNYYG